MKKKSKMGRPMLPTAKRRSAVVNVRMTPGERAALIAESKRSGHSLSDILLRAWRGETK